MCGIAGIVAPAAERYRDAVERMVDAIRHRGPDGSGINIFPDCALGHVRLSIVDLTSGGQPMLSADGQSAITFNGEIYGFREIRRELETEHQFRTTSDTEVILALYDKYGENLFRHLPGMFGFALWDEQRRQLIAGRDRFGEKPFFYAWGDGGEFLFASEIKSLLASNLFKPQINRASVAHYLRYLYVHPHQTIYSNVFTLPPAHQLRLRDGKLAVERYWDLPPARERISADEAVDEFQRLFTQAVERQLIADVPVGAFLSGGLDSSSVVAVASRTYPDLNTYSFGFGDSVNELPFAKEIAQKYGTHHNELEDDGADIADLLVEMARVFDEPFGDSSNIPTYLISQAARHFGKVVITGDGGDELLAGYDYWYRRLWEMGQAARYPQFAQDVAWRGRRVVSKFDLLTPAMWRRLVSGVEMRKAYQSTANAHAKQREVFTVEQLAGLDFHDSKSTPNGNGDVQIDDSLDAVMRADLSDYLPGDILVKIDRASMAHGLELRAPFLDVDFASFCISLPVRLKITAREEKWILRRSYEQAWTESIRARKKCGFGAPVNSWLKHPSVMALKQRILDDPGHAIFSLVPYDTSRCFVDADDYRTWTLLVLGLWLEHTGQASL